MGWTSANTVNPVPTALHSTNWDGSQSTNMATGAWFDADDDHLERHGNPNVLTRDVGTSRLTQGPSALSTLVEVERYLGTALEVTAFIPPALVSAR